MMKKLFACLLVLLAPLTVSAQATTGPLMTFPMQIKDHPQKTFYLNAAEFPFFDAQAHWNPAGAVADHETGHVGHVGCWTPYMAIVTGPFRMTCLLRSFHTAGGLNGIGNFEHQIVDPIWKDTGTSTPPDMRNDVHSLKTWEVSFTFDPRIIAGGGVPPLTKHGWAILKVMTRASLDNTDRIDPFLFFPVYMLLDPAQPETPQTGQGFALGSFIMPFNLRRPDLSASGGQNGAQIVSIMDPIPLGPIDTPWPLRVQFQNYAMLESYFGTFVFPDGTFEQRFDPDLHNGIPGTTVAKGTLSSKNGVIMNIVLDPAVMGPGNHRPAFFWFQPDGQGNDATALFTFPVTVGQSVPPPVLTCQDPNATNFLGPLPCVIPTPASWHNIATVGLIDVQQFEATGRRRLCVGTLCGLEFTVPR